MDVRSGMLEWVDLWESWNIRIWLWKEFFGKTNWDWKFPSLDITRLNFSHSVAYSAFKHDKVTISSERHTQKQIPNCTQHPLSTKLPSNHIRVQNHMLSLQGIWGMPAWKKGSWACLLYPHGGATCARGGLPTRWSFPPPTGARGPGTILSLIFLRI